MHADPVHARRHPLGSTTPLGARRFTCLVPTATSPPLSGDECTSAQSFSIVTSPGSNPLPLLLHTTFGQDSLHARRDPRRHLLDLLRARRRQRMKLELRARRLHSGGRTRWDGSWSGVHAVHEHSVDVCIQGELRAEALQQAIPPHPGDSIPMARALDA